ncbi:MAG: GNAT family N-acetyltransferase [Bauldia sp.]
MAVSFRMLEHGADDYRAMLALRDLVLRKPLGLTLMATDIAGEEDEFLLGAFEEEVLVGCVLLVPRPNDAVKLRQMAVHPDRQGRGIGRGLVIFAEDFARREGFRSVELNARAAAAGFYQRLGYRTVGDAFTEVGIEHFRMEKDL